MGDENTKQNQPQQTEGQPKPETNQEPVVAEDSKKKLLETEQELTKVKDMLLRKAAEFENYKKRAENEATTIIKFANEELISEVLPVLDDLERSLKSSKDIPSFEVLYRGIELIYQKMLKILQDQGLKTFETVGKEFDVHYHDALMQTPRSDIPPHTVVEEVQKGYMLNDKVIRHAKVIVSATPEAAESTPKTGDQAFGNNHPESAKS